MYSSYMFMFNVSQSSGGPDCLALSYLLFFILISLLMFLFTHGASHLPLIVLLGMCFSVDVRITSTNLLYISSTDIDLVMSFSSSLLNVIKSSLMFLILPLLYIIYPPWFLLSCFSFHMYNTYNYFVITHSSCCGNGCDEVRIGRANKV